MESVRNRTLFVRNRTLNTKKIAYLCKIITNQYGNKRKNTYS